METTPENWQGQAFCDPGSMLFAVFIFIVMIYELLLFTKCSRICYQTFLLRAGKDTSNSVNNQKRLIQLSKILCLVFSPVF